MNPSPPNKEVAAFESDFAAQVFAGLLRERHIETAVRNMNRDEFTQSAGWVRVYVPEADWPAARKVYETHYADEAEVLARMDGVLYVKKPRKPCPHCGDHAVLMEKPGPFQNLAGGLLSAFFLGKLAKRRHACAACRHTWSEAE